MIKKYVPFALGGVLFAMLAAAGIPSPRRAAPKVKPSAPAEKVEEAVEEEVAVEDDAPPVADHFAPEWHERFSLTPQAAIHRDVPKVEFAQVHGAPAKKRRP